MGTIHPEGLRFGSCAGIGMIALPIAFLLAAADVADPAILGKWLTERGHGVIEIVRCGNAVCGSIVGIDRTPTEPMPTDVTGRSQCGLTIVRDVTQAANNSWYGKITNPRDGATYNAALWVDNEGRLNLRGMSASHCWAAPRYGRASAGGLPTTAASDDMAGSSI